MAEWSRRDVLTGGAGAVAGAVGGVALSPSLRRAATDLMRPDSPIESVVIGADALVVRLAEGAEIDRINLIAPSGEVILNWLVVEGKPLRVSCDRLDQQGRYEVVAARNREIIQTRFIDVAEASDRR